MCNTGLGYSSALDQDGADTKSQEDTSQILTSKITQRLHEQLFKTSPTKAVPVNTRLTSAGRLRGKTAGMSAEHVASSSGHCPDHASFNDRVCFTDDVYGTA